MMSRPGADVPTGRDARINDIDCFLTTLDDVPLGAAASFKEADNGYLLRAGATKYRKNLSRFDPTPYLSVFSTCAFLEPRLLERSAMPAWAAPRAEGPAGPAPPGALASSLKTDLATADLAALEAFAEGSLATKELDPGPQPWCPKQAGKKEVLLEFFTQWDSTDQLELVDAVDVPPAERGTWFRVPKDETTDRTIFNRIPRNRLECPLEGMSRLTPSGPDLCDFEVPDDCCVFLWAEDISDYYPAFTCSKARARTNAVAWERPPGIFAGTRAHERLLKDCRKRGVPVPNKVVPCLQGLPMGDLNAPDWGTEAHYNLLSAGGDFPINHRLLNRHLFPVGQVVEAVVQDDHVALVAAPARSSPQCKAMDESFANCRRSYNAAGLEVSASKGKNGVLEGTAIGTEVLGALGLIGAPRSRRWALMRLSTRQAARRRSTGRAMRKILALWIHVLLFRRPCFCLLGTAFRDLPSIAEIDNVYDVPSSTAKEPWLLSLLAPCHVHRLARRLGSAHDRN